MAHGKTIVLEISEDGSVNIDLQNFHGQGCAKVLADFTDGDKLTHVKTKREFHEQPVAQKEGQR